MYGKSLICLPVTADTLPGIGGYIANLVNVEDLLLHLSVCLVTLICPHRGLVREYGCNNP